MIYKTLTACVFVCVASSTQAQSLDDLFKGMFKPNKIERELIQPVRKGTRHTHHHHGGGMVNATWYQSGHRTANGERFNPNGLTVAHKTLPFGTRVQFTKNGRSITARVNDRGPFRRGYQYDLSRGLARALGHTGNGAIHATVLN